MRSVPVSWWTFQGFSKNICVEQCIYIQRIWKHCKCKLGSIWFMQVVHWFTVTQCSGLFGWDNGGKICSFCGFMYFSPSSPCLKGPCFRSSYKLWTIGFISGSVTLRMVLIITATHWFRLFTTCLSLLFVVGFFFPCWHNMFVGCHCAVFHIYRWHPYFHT